MSGIYKLDRARAALFDAAGRLFEPAVRRWRAGGRRWVRTSSKFSTRSPR
jgi:hypothetical protein